MLRYTNDDERTQWIGNLTGLTPEQFAGLIGPFEAAFVQHMDAWTMEGRPRTGRRYSQYANCPLPTPEDRLLFIVSYLKVAALQVVHGTLFGMSQSNANKWIHVLLVVLYQTLEQLGDMPARHLQDLRARLDAVRPPESSDAPPLFITMALNDRLRAPKMPMSKKHTIAVRKSGIP